MCCAPLSAAPLAEDEATGLARMFAALADPGRLRLFSLAATAAGLVALILAFGPVSGAHFNPVVSLADAFFGGIAWRDVPAYLGAQVVGAIGGSVVANLMFGLDAVSWSHHHRGSGGVWLG